MSLDRIYLVGYRGTGKSTVGKLLADRLNWTFLDGDVELERAAGQSIREIFAHEGEAGFRDRESKILQDLSQGSKRVIATGGGVILREANREMLKATGPVVWLKADVETIWKRLQSDPTTSDRRPNLAQGGRDEIEQLLAQRAPLYEATADFSIDTSLLSPADVVDRILSSWFPKHSPSPKSFG